HLEQHFAARGRDRVEHRGVRLAAVAQQAQTVRIDVEKTGRTGGVRLPWLVARRGVVEARLSHASHGSVRTRCAPLPSILRPTAARWRFGPAARAWPENGASTLPSTPSRFWRSSSGFSDRPDGTRPISTS